MEDKESFVPMIAAGSGGVKTRTSEIKEKPLYTSLPVSIAARSSQATETRKESSAATIAT